jgi:3'-phosphoadenosine 5'-phosphosulfate sulfotransferase
LSQLMSSFLEIVQAAAAVATAVGVLIAGWQLGLTKQQARTSFEDQLAAQYREIARRLPIQALLGEALDGDAQTAALPDFYHYFDLSNEQAFLYGRGRVRSVTWKEWKEGIEQNLARTAFRVAWREVSRRAPDSFNDLREFVPLAALETSERKSVE